MTTIASKVDLRPIFGPVRDQGQRPTCLAFAVSDAHAALRAPWSELSCEYLFYHAQRRANRPPTAGAEPPHLLDALREDGQPVESAWIYLTSSPSSASVWNAPTGIAPLFKRASENRPNDVNEIIAQLDKGVPIIVLTMLSQSFYLAGMTTVVEGHATEHPDPSRRHAIVAVGHGEADSKRLILVRNSWGPAWGHGGYAWLSESFLTPRIFGLAILKEDLSVSPNSNAA